MTSESTGNGNGEQASRAGQKPQARLEALAVIWGGVEGVAMVEQLG